VDAVASNRILPPFPDLPPGPGAGRVSIVISNHNYARYVGGAVESALSQRDVPIEVIVVDNGSSDGSRQVLERHADRARLIFQEDRGQVGALNTGFAAATGDVVMFLDADDVLYPDIAADVVAAFARRPDAGRAVFRLELVDDEGRALGRSVPPAGSALPSGDVRTAALAHPDDLAWPPTSGNAFSIGVLRQIMPLSETPDRAGADMYLHALTPLFARVVALDRIGGCYRLHDRNAHLRPGIELERSRWVIDKARATHAAIDETSHALGYPVPEPRSVTLLVHRLFSLRAGNGAHPVAGDTRRAIVHAAVRAVAGRPDLSPRRRVVYLAWFVLASAAPRRLVPRLVDAALGRGLPSRPE